MKIGLFIAPLVLVTACGGGSASEITDAESVAELVGCSGLKKDGDTIAEEEWTCSKDGTEVSIFRFPEREGAEAVAEMGKEFGIHYAGVNDQWTVSAESEGLIQNLADEHGWETL